MLCRLRLRLPSAVATYSWTFAISRGCFLQFPRRRLSSLTRIVAREKRGQERRMHAVRRQWLAPQPYPCVLAEEIEADVVVAGIDRRLQVGNHPVDGRVRQL